MKCPKKNRLSPINTMEYLSQDILDEGFEIFAPFRSVQFFLGSCRVDVRDRFVTGPTVLQKCYSIVCALVTFYFSMDFLNTYSKLFHEYYDNNEKLLFVCGYTGQNLLYLSSLIHVRFLNNDGNVLLYIKMQNIDNIMKLNNKNSTRRSHYRQNLGTALFLVVFASTQVTVFYSLTYGQYGILVWALPLMAIYGFIFDIISCSSHVVFFTMRVQVVNSIVSDYLKDKQSNTETLSNSLHSSDVTHDKFESSHTDLYIKEIFCGFNFLRKQYRFQVWLFCTMFITWTVMAFRYFILALRSSASTGTLLDLSYICSMALINVNILLLLGIRSEAFFEEVKKTRGLCIRILSRYVDEGILRRRAKDTLKLIEEVPPTFSVYGMWRLNSRLVLDMFNVVTGAFVIVMQFTFL